MKQSYTIYPKGLQRKLSPPFCHKGRKTGSPVCQHLGFSESFVRVEYFGVCLGHSSRGLLGPVFQLSTQQRPELGSLLLCTFKMQKKSGEEGTYRGSCSWLPASAENRAGSTPGHQGWAQGTALRRSFCGVGSLS